MVHTHCASAGALGRLAAYRSSVPRIVHTYHGFPFHEFQSATRRRVHVAVERRLGQLTDVTLCVGTGVAVEAIRRGSRRRSGSGCYLLDSASAAACLAAARARLGRRLTEAALGDA